MAYPGWETVVIAFVLLSGFSVLEAGLLSVFAVLFAGIQRLRHFSSLSALFLRFGIIFVFVQILMLFDTPQSGMPWQGQYQRGYDKQVYRVGLLPWYFVAFNWFDDGTMTAAKILRSPESYGCGRDLACDFSTTRPYVMIATVEGLSAYMTYMFAIASTLYLAHYLHWRREQGMTAHAPADASTA